VVKSFRHSKITVTYQLTANAKRLDIETDVDQLVNVNDFAVAPGNPNVLAVARSFQAGVAIFDNGVSRTNTGPTTSEFIAFSATASKLYSTGFNGLSTLTIDATGVSGSPAIHLGEPITR